MANLLRSYRRPSFQVFLLGITLLCTQGIFFTVVALGGGGQQNIALSDISNVILFSVASFSSLIGGWICNALGPARTLFLGTSGNILYLGGLWYLQSTGHEWLLPASAGVLGMTFGLLWAAHSQIITDYPLDKDKGKCFSYCWSLFSLGPLIGGIIAFVVNFRNNGLKSLSSTQYIVFLIVTGFGMMSSFLVLGPRRITREDGSPAPYGANVPFKTDMLHLLTLFRDRRVLAFLPCGFMAVYFRAYIAAINAARFDAPTRGLNAGLQGAGAIIGTFLFGFFVLDQNKFWKMPARVRGYVGLSLLTVSTMATWIYSFVFQLSFTRETAYLLPLISYKDKSYVAQGTLYFLYSINDTCYAALAYWLMPRFYADPLMVARLSAIYRATNCMGACIGFAVDSLSIPLLNQQMFCWIPRLLAMLPLVFVIKHLEFTETSNEKISSVESSQTCCSDSMGQTATPLNCSPEGSLKI